MKRNGFAKTALVVFVLLVVLFGLRPLFQIETANTRPSATYEDLRISAIFDNKRNREYLYVFDSRTGDVWKYNMDAPAEAPKYIGKMTELGKGLQMAK
jgi:hypothetical protein